MEILLNTYNKRFKYEAIQKGGDRKVALRKWNFQYESLANLFSSSNKSI
ncbi:hypothetical protein PARA125_000795 [Parachlamydia sp. AcF125]|nr:hypothetical protein [Parachlamydia sp. AcF125]